MKNYFIKMEAKDIENKCSMKLARENAALVSMNLRRLIIQSQRDYRKRLSKTRKLCAKSDKYLLYGLKNSIPESWGCDLPGQ